MTQRRFLALDILRTFSVIVITFYHVWESAFGEDRMFFTKSQSIYAYLTQFFVDYWSYSGIILALISFFLIGLSKKDINWPRYLLVSIGLVGMMIHDQAQTEYQNWSWNLYGYLLVSLLTVQILPNNKKALLTLSVLSLSLLFIPIEIFQSLKPSDSPLLGQMLIGDLDATTTIGWGLLPWLSIPVLGFSVGRMIRDLSTNSLVFTGFKYEVPVLLTVAAGLIALFPFRSDVSVSSTGFYYYVFSGSVWFFWSRFAVILIWIRISCLNSANQFLSRFKIVQLNSELAWNRHFGLCYFIQFIFLSWASQLSLEFRANPWLMDLFWIGMVAATEVLARLLVIRLRSFRLTANKLVNRT
ncbi:hypothetical protein [Bdellovibrio sp. HCB288]|uniref:hypothetical protein n=1 Tax=Bdellovibrio sp. HCB288 TaxID=3394355 RepID=UPI0039B6DF78